MATIEAVEPPSLPQAQFEEEEDVVDEVVKPAKKGRKRKGSFVSKEDSLGKELLQNGKYLKLG